MYAYLHQIKSSILGQFYRFWSKPFAEMYPPATDRRPLSGIVSQWDGQVNGMPFVTV